MGKLRLDALDQDGDLLVDACANLIVTAFADPVRYDKQRVVAELTQRDPAYYRRFFIAMEAGEVVGIGGIKAADWASNTHLLYLSAVRPDRRGKGIGRALIQARLDWLKQHFPHGRVLVSTQRTKRYRELGFKDIRGSHLAGRHLMLLRFK